MVGVICSKSCGCGNCSCGVEGVFTTYVGYLFVSFYLIDFFFCSGKWTWESCGAVPISFIFSDGNRLKTLQD